jgi:serine/threonine protein kinase
MSILHGMTHLSAELLDLQAALAGEYSLQRELGRGGMGVVYLARDVQLDRDVAIKVLPTHLASDPEARDRFVREARMAAGLSHPHIVPIHRVSEATSPPAAGAAVGTRFVFFVMSYVEGETLGSESARVAHSRPQKRRGCCARSPGPWPMRMDGASSTAT